MNNTDVMLSVIMPLYNVEETLQVALDSIYMQDVNFKYEIIAIDDASQDNTLDILKSNQNIHPEIKIIEHSSNKGNAISFYDGLCTSKGKYICVLDGDDYYTVKYKLQKQVDFLNGDIEKIYVAVSHKFLCVDNEYNIINTNIFNDIYDIDYINYLKHIPYNHTTTYMYRNIFKGRVPDFFKEDYCRGDNPRTFFHLLYTKGKIKILNFVGSVYRYNYNGIWSKATTKEQLKRNIWTYKNLAKHLQTTQEKEILLNTVNEIFQDKNSDPNPIQNDCTTIYIKILTDLANKYAFSESNFSFKSLYVSTFIDSVAESLGYIEKIRRNITLSNPIQVNKDNISISISKLTTTGGGVYYEIKEIIEMYNDKSVYLLFTDLNSIEEINKDVLEELSNYKHLSLIFGQSDDENKIHKLFNEILKIKPCKIYHYLGHNNIYASTLVQSDMFKNICVFSFDHGFSLGLTHPNYDTYIAKRPTDYEMLNSKYKDKVIYIPCWNKDKSLPEKYTPFKNHTHLVTASASARFYKLQGKKDENYIDFIINLLNKTKGKHIHIGPIEDIELQNIYKKMEELNIPLENFVYISWAKNLVETLIEKNVDIFIEPFPTVSYKITLEVLSGGIPIIAKYSSLRLEMSDFLYPEVIRWNNKDEFIEKLINLSSEELQKQSVCAREYFLKTHDIKLLKEYFINEKSIYIPPTTKCIDNKIIEIDNVRNLFNFSNAKEKKKRNKIFSVYNDVSGFNKHYKIVYFLGIKFSFRNKKKDVKI